MPEFPGGMAECLKFLAKNIKYPTIAQENGVQGRVIVQFVVNQDGSIVDPVVVRSVDPYLDKEALRVIQMMPKWKPGKQRGKAVRVKYTVPVTLIMKRSVMDSMTFIQIMRCHAALSLSRIAQN